MLACSARYGLARGRPPRFSIGERGGSAHSGPCPWDFACSLSMPGGPPGPCGGGAVWAGAGGGAQERRRVGPGAAPRPQPRPRAPGLVSRLRALKGHTQHRMHHIRIELRETGARGQAVRGPAAAAPRPLLTRAARLAAPLATRCLALPRATSLNGLYCVATNLTSPPSS